MKEPLQYNDGVWNYVLGLVRTRTWSPSPQFRTWSLLGGLRDQSLPFAAHLCAMTISSRCKARAWSSQKLNTSPGSAYSTDSKTPYRPTKQQKSKHEMKWQNPKPNWIWNPPSFSTTKITHQKRPTTCAIFLGSTDKQMERTYNKTLNPEHLAGTNWDPKPWTFFSRNWDLVYVSLCYLGRE